MKVALINPISKTVNELCADHEIRAWGRKSSKVSVDVPTGFPVKSISDVKAFGPDVVVVEKRGNGVFREFAKNFDKVVDVEGLRLLLSAVPEPVVVKVEPEPEPKPEPEPVVVKVEPLAVPDAIKVAAAAVEEVEEIIQETPRAKKATSSRKKKTPTKSST
jgi:hypothetical protein